LATWPAVLLKKASWRASTVMMVTVPAVRTASVAAMEAVRLAMAPMPTEVIMLARAKNSGADVTGNW
jgi:hypothetical protein